MDHEVPGAGRYPPARRWWTQREGVSRQGVTGQRPAFSLIPAWQPRRLQRGPRDVCPDVANDTANYTGQPGPPHRLRVGSKLRRDRPLGSTGVLRGHQDNDRRQDHDDARDQSEPDADTNNQWTPVVRRYVKNRYAREEPETGDCGRGRCLKDELVQLPGPATRITPPRQRSLPSPQPKPISMTPTRS